jgi:hypothetical protein
MTRIKPQSSGILKSYLRKVAPYNRYIGTMVDFNVTQAVITCSLHYLDVRLTALSRALHQPQHSCSAESAEL